MARIGIELLARRDFHDAPEVEHDDLIADVLDDGEIVRDEQHGQSKADLQIAQQIDDLGLDRDVKRGDRLVGHDQLRL